MFRCPRHGHIGTEVFSIEVPGYDAKRQYCMHCIIDMLDKSVATVIPMGSVAEDQMDD